MTFKWSHDGNLFWKQTFNEWICFIFLKKKTHKKTAIILSDKLKQQLSAIQYRDRTYSALKTNGSKWCLLCDVVFKVIYYVYTQILDG